MGEEFDNVVDVNIGKAVGDAWVAVRLGAGVGELICWEGATSKREGIHDHSDIMAMRKRKYSNFSDVVT